jgi:putative transposase
VLTDGAGGPLSILVAPANAHDSTLIGGLIEAVVVARPPVEEHLCLDKGFDTPSAEAAVVGAGYEPHIRRIGEETKPADPATGHKPRRWVVERTIGWLSRCRGLLVRYEKKAENYLGLTALACGLLWWRKLCRLHGEPVSG